MVTDRYAAYNYFERDLRQVCWAHLARDFERFAYSQHSDVNKLGVHLRQIAMELFALRKAVYAGKINLVFFLRRAKKLRRRMWYYLMQIPKIPDVIGASRVAANIIKVEDMMWRFLEDPYAISLTNNQAERQLRHFVCKRKMSYFTQSARGERFLERVMSIYITCKQIGQNPFQHLLKIVSCPLS